MALSLWVEILVTTKEATVLNEKGGADMAQFRSDVYQAPPQHVHKH